MRFTRNNNVARSHNIRTSSGILKAWYHFTRRGRFYGYVISPAAMKRS